MTGVTRGGSVSIPLLRGLPGDAENVGNLGPRVVEEPHLGDGSGDVGVDVVAAGDEGLEAGGAAATGHVSRIVDRGGMCQPFLTDNLLAALHAQSALDDAARLTEQLGRETT